MYPQENNNNGQTPKMSATVSENEITQGGDESNQIGDRSDKGSVGEASERGGQGGSQSGNKGSGQSSSQDRGSQEGNKVGGQGGNR